MKKRVIIGVVCALLGLLVVFWLGPIVNTASQQTVEIIRLRNNITQGTEITINDLEVVAMSPTAVPVGIINDVNQIVGKFAASDLFAGDYLSATKLAGSANNADAVFASLDGSQVAISVPITFQGSVSGKLENGDIVRVYVKRGGSDEFAYTPDSLQYVRVITVTTSGGIDQDERYYNEDGSYEMPATATLLVTDAQACELVDLVNGSSLYLALVCPGDSEKAQEFLNQQNTVLEELAKAKEEAEATEPTGPIEILDPNQNEDEDLFASMKNTLAATTPANTEEAIHTVKVGETSIDVKDLDYDSFLGLGFTSGNNWIIASNEAVEFTGFGYTNADGIEIGVCAVSGGTSGKVAMLRANNENILFYNGLHTGMTMEEAKEALGTAAEHEGYLILKSASTTLIVTSDIFDETVVSDIYLIDNAIVFADPVQD